MSPIMIAIIVWDPALLGQSILTDLNLKYIMGIVPIGSVLTRYLKALRIGAKNRRNVGRVFMRQRL